MEREALRRRILAMRDALPDRAEQSRLLCARLRGDPVVARARVIAAFAPFRSEPALWPVWEELLHQGKALLLPRTLDGGRLSFHTTLGPDYMRPGRFGIAEPEGPEWPIAAAELILVPGCAFDRSGGRMGYGGGYYDRLLAELPEGTTTLGLAFREQLLPEVPMEAHDRRVGGLMTPEETLWFEGEAL